MITCNSKSPCTCIYLNFKMFDHYEQNLKMGTLTQFEFRGLVGYFNDVSHPQYNNTIWDYLERKKEKVMKPNLLFDYITKIHSKHSCVLHVCQKQGVYCTNDTTFPTTVCFWWILEAHSSGVK